MKFEKMLIEKEVEMKVRTRFPVHVKRSVLHLQAEESFLMSTYEEFLSCSPWTALCGGQITDRLLRYFPPF